MVRQVERRKEGERGQGVEKIFKKPFTTTTQVESSSIQNVQDVGKEQTGLASQCKTANKMPQSILNWVNNKRLDKC